MTPIEELEFLAEQSEANREAAVAAMITLARIYGNGRDGIRPDLFTAWGWAEKAAIQDSPDGYLEITRIIGSACIATEDYAQKTEYAAYVIGTCDATTLCRFKRADIAYNVGSVCEYMAVTGRHKMFGSRQDVTFYRATAVAYYKLAVDLMAQKEVTPNMREEILQANDRIGQNVPRPLLERSANLDMPRFL